ncbi:hypothetical protein pb186bvf_000333 [Paramecium bursaria]
MGCLCGTDKNANKNERVLKQDQGTNLQSNFQTKQTESINIVSPIKIKIDLLSNLNQDSSVFKKNIQQKQQENVELMSQYKKTIQKIKNDYQKNLNVYPPELQQEFQEYQTLAEKKSQYLKLQELITNEQQSFIKCSQNLDKILNDIQNIPDQPQQYKDEELSQLVQLPQSTQNNEISQKVSEQERQIKALFQDYDNLFKQINERKTKDEEVIKNYEKFQAEIVQKLKQVNEAILKEEEAFKQNSLAKQLQVQNHRGKYVLTREQYGSCRQKNGNPTMRSINNFILSINLLSLKKKDYRRCKTQRQGKLSSNLNQQSHYENCNSMLIQIIFIMGICCSDKNQGKKKLPSNQDQNAQRSDQNYQQLKINLEEFNKEIQNNILEIRNEIQVFENIQPQKNLHSYIQLKDELIKNGQDHLKSKWTPKKSSNKSKLDQIDQDIMKIFTNNSPPTDFNQLNEQLRNNYENFTSLLDDIEKEIKYQLDTLKFFNDNQQNDTLDEFYQMLNFQTYFDQMEQNWNKVQKDVLQPVQMEILYSYQMRWAKLLNWHKNVNDLKNDNIYILLKFTFQQLPLLQI